MALELASSNLEGERAIETHESKTECLKQIAAAMLQQKYPLSQVGQEIKNQVAIAIERSDTNWLIEHEQLLSTVENPHLEYYADLEATEEQLDDIFNRDHLQIIQVTEGCSRQCSYCAGNPETAVGQMPLSAVGKIGTELERQYDHYAAVWENWRKSVKQKTGTDIDAIHPDYYRFNLRSLFPKPERNDDEEDDPKDKVFSPRPDLAMLLPQFSNFYFLARLKGFKVDEKWSVDQLMEFLYGNKDDYRLIDAIQKTDTQKYRTFVCNIIEIASTHQINTVFDMGETPDEIRDYLSSFYHSVLVKSDYLQAIHPYYNNEAFDYRDKNFRHQNGEPADFGDVAVLLTHHWRLDITTSGWAASNIVARRAAQKINRLAIEQSGSVELRLSVNNTIGKSREGKYAVMGPEELTRYVEDVKRYIFELRNVPMEINFICEGDQSEFATRVIEPIREYVSTLVQQWKLEETRVALDFLVDSDPSNIGHTKEKQSTIQSDYQAFPASHYATGEKDDSDVMSCGGGFIITPKGRVLVQTLPDGTERKNNVYIGFEDLHLRPKPTGVVLWEEEG